MAPAANHPRPRRILLRRKETETHRNTHRPSTASALATQRLGEDDETWKARRPTTRQRNSEDASNGLAIRGRSGRREGDELGAGDENHDGGATTATATAGRARWQVINAAGPGGPLARFITQAPWMQRVHRWMAVARTCVHTSVHGVNSALSIRLLRCATYLEGWPVPHIRPSPPGLLPPLSWLQLVFANCNSRARTHATGTASELMAVPTDNRARGAPPDRTK